MIGTPTFPPLPPEGTFLIIGTITCSFCRRAEHMLRKHPAKPPVIKHTLRTEIEKQAMKDAGFSTVPIIFHGHLLIGGSDHLDDYLKHETL